LRAGADGRRGRVARNSDNRRLFKESMSMALMHPQFDPVAVSLGHWHVFGRDFAPAIHWYGLTYMVAFGLFIWLAGRRAALPWYARTGWIRRDVEEPELWRTRSVSAPMTTGLRRLFEGPYARLTSALTFMNACTLFAWWGFYLWLPSYLVQPASQGGIGLELVSSSGFILVMQAGMWVGYVTFGYISDAIGRKPTYVAYLLLASLSLAAFLSTRNTALLLALGPFVAFFGTGYFSGFGAVTAEIYPTAIRATAQGFTYNTGRLVSALAPFTVGSLAQTHGFGVALSVSSAAFLLAAIAWVAIPETKGRQLR